MPSVKFWIGNDSGGFRSRDGKGGWRGGFGSVNEAIEMLASKVRDNLGFPEKVIFMV